MDAPKTEFGSIDRFDSLSESKRAFLSAYCQCGKITKAAKHAGISRHTHYLRLNNDEKYKAAFEECRASNVSRIEAGLVERLAEGWDEPVFQNGELIGCKRKFDHGTALRYLQAVAPETFRKVIIHQEGETSGIDPEEFDAIVRRDVGLMIDSVPSGDSPNVSELLKQFGDLPIHELIEAWKRATTKEPEAMLRTMLDSMQGGTGNDDSEANDEN